MSSRALPIGRHVLALPPAPEDRVPSKRSYAPLVALLAATLVGTSMLDSSRFIASYFAASMVLGIGFIIAVLAAGWLKSVPVAPLIRNWFVLAAWTLWAAVAIFTVRDPSIHFKWLAIVWIATTASVALGALAVRANPCHIATALLIANLVWTLSNAIMVPLLVTGIPGISDMSKDRFSGVLLNPNTMAVNSLVLMTPLLFHLRYLRSANRALALVLITLSAVLVLLTLSRKGVAGLVFVLLCYAILNLRGTFLRTTAVLILLCTMSLLLISRNPFSKRVTYVTDPGAEQVDVRIELAIGGLSIGADNPWLGVGLGHSEEYFGTYTHNNYVEVFMTTGAIGLVLYYGPLLWIAWRLIRSPHRDHLWGMAVTLLAWKLLVNDMGVVSYYTPPLIMSLAWVGAIALRPTPRPARPRPPLRVGRR